MKSMMRGRAWILLLVLTLVWCKAAAVAWAEVDFPIATCEQIVSGEVYGQTVYAQAIAVKIQPLYNLRYMWAIRKQDGTFAIIEDQSGSRWAITEEKYRNASDRHRQAIDSQEVMKLELDFSSSGLVDVRSFVLPGERSFTEQQNLTVKWMLVLLACCVVAIPTMIVIVCKTPRRTPYKYTPEVVSTRILDSYNTQSGGNAAGRAVVGGVLGGTLGAIVGAATAKRNEVHWVTFKVFYNNGTSKTETVASGTATYDKYIKLVEID